VDLGEYPAGATHLAAEVREFQRQALEWAEEHHSTSGSDREK
jgi:hypothetical protein